jgi:hypothetical protein
MSRLLERIVANVEATISGEVRAGSWELEAGSWKRGAERSS